MRAAAAGDIKAVKKHLSKKGKKNSKADMVLLLAAKVGHRDVVEFLDPTDKNGTTALMRAAGRGDAEMVKLLAPLQKGAKDKDGNTAFIHALRSKREGIALLLIEHESRSLPEKCLVQSNLAEPDRPVLATSQSPSSC